MEENKKNIDLCFFTRKEVKRMRHFVTHGHDIWLKYYQDDGKRTIEQVTPPRLLCVNPERYVKE